MATVRSNSFSVKIDTEPVGNLATRLETLANRSRLRIGAAEAANAVVERFDVKARKGMNAGINLSDEYIASKMRLTPAVASGSGPVRAELVARGDLTIIAHYPHEQLRVAGSPVRSGRSRGRRPSGVAVEIKTGAAEFEPQWFTMRLRNVGRPGLFVRTSATGGKPKHLYGPSPYSLFRYQIEAGEAELVRDLENTAASTAAATIERALR